MKCNVLNVWLSKSHLGRSMGWQDLPNSPLKATSKERFRLRPTPIRFRCPARCFRPPTAFKSQAIIVDVNQYRHYNTEDTGEKLDDAKPPGRQSLGASVAVREDHNLRRIQKNRPSSLSMSEERALVII